MGKLLNGNITISRPRGGGSDNAIEIVLRDSLSRTRFVKASIGLAEFTELLTGLSEVECRLDVRGLDRVGMRVETQTLEVDKVPGIRAEQAQEVRRVFEASILGDFGWRLSSDGTGSQQNGDKHTAIVRRYVDPETGEPPATAPTGER